jgi:hypothetical protein
MFIANRILPLKFPSANLYFSPPNRYFPFLWYCENWISTGMSSLFFIGLLVFISELICITSPSSCFV